MEGGKVTLRDVTVRPRSSSSPVIGCAARRGAVRLRTSRGRGEGSNSFLSRGQHNHIWLHSTCQPNFEVSATDKDGRMPTSTEGHGLVVKG